MLKYMHMMQAYHQFLPKTISRSFIVNAGTVHVCHLCHFINQHFKLYIHVKNDITINARATGCIY